MQRMQDRVAVITGAGSGIGLASARRLAAEGARVVAVDIDEAAGKAAAAEIGGIFLAADVSVEDEAEAIAVANDTPYGLSGSIWTENIGRALRVARAVETGNLSVNSHASVRYWTPFGGFKQSGLGRELGPDALDAFTEVKNVFIATE